jgi:hypothetical protein
MATPIAAPNLQRFTLPEIDISYDSNGIISIIDDLVERVMSVHYRRAQQSALAASESRSAEENVATLLSLHSVYDFPQGEEAAA